MNDQTPPAASGDDLLAVTIQCLTCEGDGYYERWIEDAEGRDYPVALPCDICGGTGELRDDGEDDPE